MGWNNDLYRRSIFAFTHTATKVDFNAKQLHTFLISWIYSYGYKLNVSDSMEFSISKNENRFTIVLKNGEIVVSEIKHVFFEEEAKKFLNELNSAFLSKQISD